MHFYWNGTWERLSRSSSVSTLLIKVSTIFADCDDDIIVSGANLLLYLIRIVSPHQLVRTISGSTKKGLEELAKIVYLEEVKVISYNEHMEFNPESRKDSIECISPEVL